MKSSHYLLALAAIVAIISAEKPVYAFTEVRDSSVLRIAHHIWNNEFDDAIKGAEQLIKDQPGNPLGYFIKGTVYQTISEEFRNDMYKDEIDELLTDAIERAEELHDTDRDNANWRFISGASYGYRALQRAFHGRWFASFRDGLRCSAHLNDAIELDSTFFDAYVGLGAYNYYKTIMAENFLWLPFISDRREEGIAQIKKTIDHGFLASYNARESLLRIYFNEQRYEDAVALADSLEAGNPNDAYCLLYYAQSLMMLDRTDEANDKLRALRRVWKNSPYFDDAGIFEVELVDAKIFYRQGDLAAARRITDKILSLKGLRDDNAYFAETYDSTKAFVKRMK
ncbi:MAG: hypothetical protein JW763_07745 [candidate division Zixibacteria bacterium]|nr:hypothetical protein [candidate division Zixibacteria bacterium]